VQISTDVENAAMRAVAERLGFGLEGVLRGFMPDPRGPRDYAIYGMTKGRYEDVMPTWTSTS
jgi:RimJ/RimL family protein N-acetyltransferase